MKNRKVAGNGLGRKWVAVFVGTVLVCVGALQLGRLAAKGKFRHEVDYKVYLATEPSAISGNAETVLLADSVTFGPISKYTLRGDVCDLTSNQAISLAGNFFLLERYLRHHRTPQRVHLFFIYDLFFNRLKSPYTYLCFTTVFAEKSERKDLERIGRGDVYEKLNCFNATKADLKKNSHWVHATEAQTFRTSRFRGFPQGQKRRTN